MRNEAEIDRMTPDNWDTMLALAKTKDEAIKEKLIVIPDLTFDAAMATIETIEKAQCHRVWNPPLSGRWRCRSTGLLRRSRVEPRVELQQLSDLDAE